MAVITYAPKKMILLSLHNRHSKCTIYQKSRIYVSNTNEESIKFTLRVT